MGSFYRVTSKWSKNRKHKAARRNMILAATQTMEVQNYDVYNDVIVANLS